MSTSQQEGVSLLSSNDISHYDISIDSDQDLIQKNLQFTYALQVDPPSQTLITDSYQKCKQLSTFKSIPNVILLYGECSCDCELLAYTLHQKLTGSKDSSTFLDLHEGDHWNPDASSVSSVIISSYKCLYDKLVTISDILLEPGTTQWLFIVSDTISTQLTSLIELFPHWIFMIPPYLSTKEETSYVDTLCSNIKENPKGLQDFWYPIYSFHSNKWNELKEKQKRIIHSFQKNSLIHSKK